MRMIDCKMVEIRIDDSEAWDSFKKYRTCESRVWEGDQWRLNEELKES